MVHYIFIVLREIIHLYIYSNYTLARWNIVFLLQI